MHWSAILSIVAVVSIVVFIVMFALVCIMPMVSEASDTTCTLDKAIQAYHANRQNRLPSSYPIVMSFTTTPKRLLNRESLEGVLKSMLNQTVPAQEICINIPAVMKRTGEEYVIPEWLSMQKGIFIHRCDDWGPATKYIPTLIRYQNQPEQRILVLDDDMILPTTYVETLQKALAEYPDAVICGHGWILDRDNTGNVSMNPKDGWISSKPLVFAETFQGKRSLNMDESHRNIDIVGGFQGYVVQPRFFDMEELCNYDNKPKEAWQVDDVVISAHLAQRGVPRYCVVGVPFLKLERKNFWKWLAEFAGISAGQSSLSTTVNKTNDANNVVVRFFQNVW